MKSSSMNKSVMIVEDEEDARALFRLMLESSYSIIEVKSGMECLEELKTHKPDLILLDIMMPDMDGWQVLREIKENAELEHIPVIIISASKQDLSTAEKGIAAYTTKPISKYVLLNTIESIFLVKEILGEPEKLVS